MERAKPAKKGPNLRESIDFSKNVFNSKEERDFVKIQESNANFTLSTDISTPVQSQSERVSPEKAMSEPGLPKGA